MIRLIARPGDEFRRYIPNCTLVMLFVRFLQFPGNTEIDNHKTIPDVTPLSQHYVLKLYIPMHYVSLMAVIQSVPYFIHDTLSLFLEHLASNGIQMLLQTATRKMLHKQYNLCVSQLNDIEKFNDVLVPQILQNLCFLIGLEDFICLEDCWIDGFNGVLLFGNDMLTKDYLSKPSFAKLFDLMEKLHIYVIIKVRI